MRAFGIVLVTIVVYIVESNRYAEQLYEDLLYYYNKNVRPVKNASESIKVKFGASLIRIIDVVEQKIIKCDEDDHNDPLWTPDDNNEDGPSI
uniref:Neurotransmitter-gated ion-channel ligand-binding domain containing protein n=1 Tax=Haemonchus contortus TaxID=6289 RepID=W6NV03_HAECO